MPLPVIIGGILGALTTSITATLKFADNKIVAYFLVIGLIVLDAGVGFALNYQGVIGILFTTLINSLGIPIIIYSWQVAILFALLPFVLYAFGH